MFILSVIYLFTLKSAFLKSSFFKMSSNKLLNEHTYLIKNVLITLKFILVKQNFL